jgi:hypothetical protein
MKMKTTFKAILAVCLLVTAAFTSCKKGDTGPVGPTGAQGTAGSSNVTNYSITIHSNNWYWNSANNQWLFSYNLTADFNSAVYGYVMSGNGKEAMPYINPTNFSITTFANVLFQTTPSILFEYYDGTTTLTAPTSDVYLYLVVIPPAMKKPNINYSDYKSVKSAYNLKD